MTFLESPYDWLFAHKVWIFAALLGLTALGFVVDLLRGNPRHHGETLTNVAIFVGNNSMNLFLAQALQLAAFTWIASFVPWKIPTNGLTLAGAFVLVDLCYYWRHRWEHEVHLLWCEHSVHHSSEEYNFSTSLRLPVINPLFGWVFFVPLALLGFPAKLVLAGFFLNLLYQYWIHNNSIGKLPALDYFLSTPSNHRVHHARNRAVRRNACRFPDDFMFPLTEEEHESLRYRIGTLKTGRGSHRKYLPLVFTEQGVAMLSSVLNSERAVHVNIAIVRAFVKLRELLETNKDFAKKLARLERKLLRHDDQFKVIFDAIRQLMETGVPAAQKRIRGLRER
jgi:hypothetical protein